MTTLFLKDFAADRRGATAAEYALLASILVVGIVASFAALAPSGWFESLTQAVSARVPA